MFILDCTQTRNLDLDNIAILQPGWRFHESSNTAGGTSHDDRPRLERRPTTQEPQYSRNVMDQVVGRRVLSLFAIHKSLQMQSSRLWNCGRRCNDWTNRSKLVERFRIAMLPATALWSLPVTRRDVVANGVAENIGRGIFVFSEIFEVFADDYCELALDI